MKIVTIEYECTSINLTHTDGGLLRAKSFTERIVCDDEVRAINDFDRKNARFVGYKRTGYRVDNVDLVDIV
ncbi:MAG TPA: hypothetical protein PK205_07210 [Promineifilum sp.]|mgnify:CR=1 FL=1|nr:hypothetical protein [Promineifilum sp.]